MDDNSKQAIVNELVARGVNRETAEKLAREKPQECRRQLAALEFRALVPRSQAASLVVAIKQAWEVPAGMDATTASRQDRMTASCPEGELGGEAECFEELGLEFPSLRDAEGLRPWNPRVLDWWASRPGRDAAAVHAARFVLGCYCSARTWSCGRFDLFEAERAWDREARLVFLEWIREYL